MASSQARMIAAQCWCDDRVSDRVMDVKLAEVFAEQIDEYLEALQWISGAEDFQDGGKARIGFEKIVRPLLDQCIALPGTST